MSEDFLSKLCDDLNKANLRQWYGDEAVDFNAELKDGAWNVLHENPGYGFDEWRQALIEEYPTEVVDALGSDPFEASASLADMWDSWDYEDVETGECHTFQEWAEYFATEKSVELYDLLVDAKREISHLDLLRRRGQ